MTLVLAFWIILIAMLVFMVFELWTTRTNIQVNRWNILIFILLLLLGWSKFVPLIH